MAREPTAESGSRTLRESGAKRSPKFGHMMECVPATVVAGSPSKLEIPSTDNH